MTESTYAHGDGQVDEFDRWPIRRAKSPIPRNTSPEEHCRRIDAYLPSNYECRVQPFGSPLDASEPYVEILGHDYAGWTLQGYVIPRLQSGLIATRAVEDGE